MNNQPGNLANAVSNTNQKDNEANENVEDDENAVENDVENIKSVDLTGKDAMSLNTNTNNNNSKPLISNLTKKKNNSMKNLTLKQNLNGNINTRVETEDSSKTDASNIMRSLNKVAMNLLNHQIVMKLFHFQTELYGAHKASDAYIEKFATTMDKFLEIAQGIYGRLTIKKFKLEGSSHTDDNILKHIEGMIMLLRNGINDVLDNYTDLINVRDELVGDAEQLKYLLTFK